MMSKNDVQRWLDGVKTNEFVGVDDDGLTLQACDANGKLLDYYLELGGIPED